MKPLLLIPLLLPLASSLLLIPLLLPLASSLPMPYYLLKPPAPPGATPIDLSAWQSLLPPGTPMSSLSIPGTHDTMAYPKNGRKLPPTVETQLNDLATQLRKGVRYLDFRLQHINDRFTLHHGKVYLYFDFTEVLAITNDFLEKEGNDESILVRIMCTNCYFSGRGAGGIGENGNTRKFAETMEWYRDENPDTREFFKNRVHAGFGIPKLGDVRGKVVILQGFTSESLMFGILWGNCNMVSIQDSWVVSGVHQAMTKVKLIHEFFNNVVQKIRHPIPITTATTTTAVSDRKFLCNTPPLAVNHFSGSGLFWGPRGVSNHVYSKLYQWMKWEWDNGGGKPIGIIVGDYMTEAITRVIIEKNFLKGGAGENVADKVDFRWEYWNEGFKQEKEGVRIIGAYRLGANSKSEREGA